MDTNTPELMPPIVFDPPELKIITGSFRQDGPYVIPQRPPYPPVRYYCEQCGMIEFDDETRKPIHTKWMCRLVQYFTKD